MSIVALVIHEFWQCLALGKQYFMELENWFELLILSLAIITLSLKAKLDTLKVVAAVGICLSWIELIFLFGRYPFFGRDIIFLKSEFLWDLFQEGASASCIIASLKGL